MEEFKKKLENRIAHLRDERVFMKQFVRSAKLAEALKIQEWLREPASKKAVNADEAWKIQDTHTGKTHGWVQWKGTEVCMDVYCKCGCGSHVDGSFAYNVKCPECGTVYMCNGHIELIELEKEPDSCVLIGE